MTRITAFLIGPDADDPGGPRALLAARDLDVRGFATMAAAIDALAVGAEPRLIVSELELPDGDGLRLLRAVQRIDPLLPVIVVSSRVDMDIAARVGRAGAHAVLHRPLIPLAFLAAVHAADAFALRRFEADRIFERLTAGRSVGLLGESRPMQAVRHRVQSFARSAVDVLVYGEGGTGKEVAARQLHELSGEKGPFIAAACCASSAAALDIELFGLEAGAFPGATQRRVGRIERAAGGTLFLDDSDAMPPTTLARLLRAMEQRTFERVGGDDPVPVACRFVFSSRSESADPVLQDSARNDLASRLQVAILRMPPLREHPEDIPFYFEVFVALAARSHGVTPPAWTVGDLNELLLRTWPGNVRELRGVAERWGLGLEPGSEPPRPGPPTLAEALARTERLLIESALREHAGNVQQSADRLGLPRKTLYDKLSRLDIDPASFRPHGVVVTRSPGAR